VIANGDIKGPATARQALAKSGADGVMIGRGARGKPWALAQVAHGLFGAPAPDVPQGENFADMVAAHYEAMIRFYGAGLGLRVARKHLGWYMDTCETPSALRKAVLTAPTVSATLSLLRPACAMQGAAAA
jgi:tRNA-dihydrouridine synthase B